MTSAYKVENLANIVLDNTYRYAKEVSLNRMVPYAKDGLKPVARALAYSLYLSSVKSGNKLIKSQTACSDVIGKYHPHSMESVYETAVKLAHDRGSILESGSVLSSRVSDSYTAPRYSDIRLSPLGRELFTTIGLCEMVESDMGYTMPRVLWARFPYQLFTYYLNIGVGVSNCQIPFNPKEVIDAMVAMIDKRIAGEQMSTDEIMEYIKGPDLYRRSTIYMSRESLRHLIDVGTGSCIEVCDVEVYHNKGEIHIRELPYRENSPDLQASIIEKSNNYHDKVKELGDMNKIKGIKDEVGAVEDKSSEDDIRIIVKVDMEKSSIEEVLNELYNKTNIKRSHIIKHIMVDDETDKLELYSVREIMENCIDVNIKHYKKIYSDELEGLRRQFEVNKVLEKVTRPEHTDFIGKAIYRKDKVEVLMGREGLGLSEYEIKEILFKNPSILRRLSDRDKVLEEIEEYNKKRDKILEKLKPENILRDVKRYYEDVLVPLVKDMDRYSEVVYSPLALVTPKPREVRLPEGKVVFIKSDGFIYSVYEDEGIDTEAGDIEKVLYLKEDEHVVIVTDKAHVKIPVRELSEDGAALQSLIVGIPDAGERVVGVFPQFKKAEKGFVYYFVDNKGCVKAVREDVLYSSTKVTKGTEMDSDSYIVDTYRIREGDVSKSYLAVVTEKGYVKVIPFSLFNPKGRVSKYNRATLLGDDDKVVYTGAVYGDVCGVKVYIEDDIGGSREIVLDKEYIKPVYNKGCKVIDKGRCVSRCDLRVDSGDGYLLKA